MTKKLPEESNKIEYKEKLPEENNKWLKTVSSFSNTAGGRLIIGVEDIINKVIGIDTPRTVLESRIIDTIYNNISPTPLINIVFQNIQDKDVLIVEISPGNRTPYYIKSLGIDEGSYVRFGSTDRLATQSQLYDLLRASERKSFSSELYHDKSFEKHQIEKNEIAVFLSELNKKKITKKINESKLAEWELIVKDFENVYATNGYMLLTANPFYYGHIRLGIFEGKDKARLYHDEEFKGSILSQYEESVERLKEILYKGYSFKKVRTKEYSIPEEVIREVMANAIVHRNYKDEHPIRVEIYEDRISVYSPGSLYQGIQLEDMLSGVSKLRNRNIAEVFHSLGYIEKWGSGIQRSNKILEENGMRPLEIDAESIHGVTVTIYFEKAEDKKVLEYDNRPLEIQILDYYSSAGGSFTRKDVEKTFNLTERQTRTIIEKLQKEEHIVMKGGGRSTYYKII